MQCKCGCGGQALYSYVWAWGETGVACEALRFRLGQMAQRLNRQVTVTPLEPGAEPPVTRDERIAAQSRILALQAEIEELQARSLTMGSSIDELRRQLNTAEAQRAALSDEATTLRQTVGYLRTSLETSEQAHASERAEVDRLRQRLVAYGVTLDGP